MRLLIDIGISSQFTHAFIRLLLLVYFIPGALPTVSSKTNDLYKSTPSPTPPAANPATAMPILILMFDAPLVLDNAGAEVLPLGEGAVYLPVSFPARGGVVFNPGKQACGVLIDDNIIMNERRVVPHGVQLIGCAGDRIENVARGFGVLGNFL